MSETDKIVPASLKRRASSPAWGPRSALRITEPSPASGVGLAVETVGACCDAERGAEAPALGKFVYSATMRKSNAPVAANTMVAAVLKNFEVCRTDEFISRILCAALWTGLDHSSKQSTRNEVHALRRGRMRAALAFPI